MVLIDWVESLKVDLLDKVPKLHIINHAQVISNRAE